MDVGRRGLQEKSDTSSEIDKGQQIELGRDEEVEWVRETKSPNDSRKDGKVGDQTSHINLPPKSSKSPQGSHDEVGNNSSERGLPDDIQNHPGEENATCPTLNEEQGNRDENTTVLTDLLGTKAAVSFNSSFGVEFILEEMSLQQEVKGKVVVKPEIRYVTCSHERDTSRTHNELLMQASEGDTGGSREKKAFLAMPVVYGPSEAEFHIDRPARLRFFAGYFDDLKKQIRGAYSNSAVERYLQQEYEPLVSPDGNNWRMLPTFDVQFKPSPDEWKEAWLETRLYHFSLVAFGKWIRKSEGKIEELNSELSYSRLPQSKFADDCTSICGMPLLTRLENRGSVIFGNATKEDLFFYASKKEDIGFHRARTAHAISTSGGGFATEKEQEVEIKNHDNMDRTYKYEVPTGRYRMVSMPMDGSWVQSQIVCGVFLPEQRRRSLFFLLKERLKKDKVFVVLPRTIDRWSSKGGEDTADKLDYNAQLPTIREFLSNH